MKKEKRTLAVPIDEHGNVGKAIDLAPVEGYVWCCVCGAVHDKQEIYDRGEPPSCSIFDWQELFANKEFIGKL